MKKIVIVLFIFMSIYLYSEGKKNDEFTIPNESIRMRVIANSNEAEDQIIKYDLVNSLNELIKSVENNSKNITDSRNAIKKAIPLIEEKLSSLNIEGTVKYGSNYFPEKTYKKVNYKEGNYESLVVTIGSGLGENWWCVLFPPLCLMETQKENLSDVEYSLYVKNIIDKYL